MEPGEERNVYRLRNTVQNLNDHLSIAIEERGSMIKAAKEREAKISQQKTEIEALKRELAEARREGLHEQW